MPRLFRPAVVVTILGITTYLWIAFLRDAPAAATGEAPEVREAGPTAPGPGEPGSEAPDPGETGRIPLVIDPTNTDPRFTRFTDGTIHFVQSFVTSRGLHRSPDPLSDLEAVEQLLSDYRLVYKENPVGTENAEIVAQLLGGNPRRIFFLDPGLPALTADRELLDRWGSPYIFHPLKADVMDIRSPGPDRKPWTADDLTRGLEDLEKELLLHPEE